MNPKQFENCANFWPAVKHAGIQELKCKLEHKERKVKEE